MNSHAVTTAPADWRFARVSPERLGSGVVMLNLWDLRERSSESRVLLTDAQPHARSRRILEYFTDSSQGSFGFLLRSFELTGLKPEDPSR